MKHLVFIFFIALVFGYCKSEQIVAKVSPEKSAALLSAVMKCIAESGVDSSILIQVNGNKESDDKNVQKFIFCALKTSGVTDKHGRVKTDRALEFFPKNVDKQVVRKVFEDCNKENGNNPLETTFKVYKCYRKNTPVRLILS